MNQKDKDKIMYEISSIFAFGCKLMKLNDKGKAMVQHHIEYEELHGQDKVVMMTKSDHVKLHLRLRQEGKCNVPVDELGKISMAARRRSGIERNYDNEHVKEHAKEYFHKNITFHEFSENIGIHIQFRERVRYNSLTGLVSYYAHFRGKNGYTLPVHEVM